MTTFAKSFLQDSDIIGNYYMVKKMFRYMGYVLARRDFDKAA